MNNEPQDSKASDSSSQPPVSMNSQKKSSKKKKAAVYGLSALLIGVLIIVGTIIGVFFHYYSLMDTDNNDYDYSDTVSVTDEHTEEPPGTDVKLSDDDIYSDKNVFNILLIGTDERTEKFDPYARADSIMILSLNQKTHSVKLVSLERGITVRMSGKIKYTLLTHTFHYGGEKLVMETVRTHFKLDTDRYIRVNFSVFEKLINRIGGVDITLSAKEAEALNAYESTDVTEGKNHLDGRNALRYVRLRSIDSDWHRIKRQRKVIASLKNGFKGKSVIELNQVMEECLPYVKTNLSSIEFADLMIHTTQYVQGDFKEMSLPKKGTYQGLKNVDYKANSRILREFLYG